MTRSSNAPSTGSGGASRRRRLGAIAGFAIVAVLAFAPSAQAGAAKPNPSAPPDFGPNVFIFDPSMPQGQIQATVDAIAAQQVDNEFGAQRYALLFKPGVYGSAANPLTFQVGYYTEVAGLGRSPSDVTINGHVDVYNRCLSANNCIALDNFWRSMSNLTIHVMGLADCRSSGDFWAVSQAAPMRRVDITGGNLTLMDYCTAGPQYASGGFIADSRTGFVINGSQQQFLVRNSTIGGWSNAVWNQVFSGVEGAPAQSFPNPTYTTLPTSGVTREAPYLYIDADGQYRIFVPAARANTAGTSWASGPTPGRSIAAKDIFVAHPGDKVKQINNALAKGRSVLFTPGIYQIDKTIKVKRPDTVVLGLGLATLEPQNGVVPMKVADVPGVQISGLIFDAGPARSPVLLEVGNGKGTGHADAADPTGLTDVFFRIGGAHAGRATTSLVVNSDHVVLDDIWAWRADHGTGVGWTVNTSDTGVIVNGDDVTAYGLFVEHHQKTETIWNGDRGSVVFFQNEMPYDPPSQADWMAAPGHLGYPALKVADTVTTFNGSAMGSYSFFNQGVDIFSADAFEVPATLPAGSLHDLLTIFLDASVGKGGILHVVNDTGGSSTIANPDVPVPVVSYP